MIFPGEPNDYAAEILFFLPLSADPGQGKTGHGFVLGEVQIKLTPVDDWVDVALDHIIELGYGWYAIRLTAAQRANVGVIAYRAVCADAQPDRGTETIDDLDGDVAVGGDGWLPFYLANLDDPVEGAPLEGHVFTDGEVLLRLPDGVLANADVDDVVEFGGGLYALRVTAAAGQTLLRGKALIVVNPVDEFDAPVAKSFSGYRTILGRGATGPAVPAQNDNAPLSSRDRVGGDLALIWSSTTGDADLTLIAFDSDVTADQGLTTAVLLSLFTDRRANNDDKPPSGDPQDRRGWWADQFAAVAGDKFGSRLWLLDRSKRTNETALRTDEYVREALAWMVEDRVVSSIDVTVELTDKAVIFAVGLNRPGRDPVSFRFVHAWSHMQEAA